MYTVRGAVSKAHEEEVVDTEEAWPAVDIKCPPRTATNAESADLLVWDKNDNGNGRGSFKHIFSLPL